MGKKYIIELEEPEIFDERKFYQCSQMPWWAVSESIVENLTPYTEPDLDAIRNEAYEKGVQDTKQHWVDAPRTCAYKLGYENGLNDAWEAARKITDMETEKRDKVFEETFTHRIFRQNTYSEAIEKIRQYEQEKEEIKVGDEVSLKSGSKGVVTRILMLGNEPSSAYVVWADGYVGCYDFGVLQKTERRFPEIATVLQKMRGKE